MSIINASYIISPRTTVEVVHHHPGEARLVAPIYAVRTNRDTRPIREIERHPQNIPIRLLDRDTLPTLLCLIIVAGLI